MLTETIVWRLAQDETPTSYLIVLAHAHDRVFSAYWTGDAWNLERNHKELDGVTMWTPFPHGPKELNT